MTLTTERQQFAAQNEMSMEFVNWFFDEKKNGCGNAWFIMAAAMWEGWKGRANREVQPDGWIACSERMPEPNKYVQVSNGVWVGIGEYNDSEQFEFDERWQDEHGEFIDLLHHPVTHWMPLPSLPQEA